jgi:hypothetical protein
MFFADEKKGYMRRLFRLRDFGLTQPVRGDNIA